MRLLFLAPHVLAACGAFAAETDAFTFRYAPLEDALPEINREVSVRVDAALRELSQTRGEKTACDWESLDAALGSRLRRPFLGEVERFINHSPSMPRIEIQLADSIYRNLPAVTRIPIEIGTLIGVGLGPAVAHDGLIVGSDKFGHFLDEGYYYYLVVHRWGYTVEDALELGSFLETGVEGSLLSGIYSYGDLAANYDGYLFWKDMLGLPGQRDSRYFGCDAGNWSLKRQVDLGEYVNAAWDEGMNCSEFRSPQMVAAIETEVKAIERREKKRVACPVYPERVPAMIERYGAHAARIIHPKLLEQARGR